jgi:hypothetical protein
MLFLRLSKVGSAARSDELGVVEIAFGRSVRS